MRLVASNDKPIKPKKIKYCPICNSSRYFFIYAGALDQPRPIKIKICYDCHVKGIETRL